MLNHQNNWNGGLWTLAAMGKAEKIFAGIWRKRPLKSNRALSLLLMGFLYADILITTSLQPASNAATKKQMPPTSVRLMMSVGRYPLSSNLKK